MYVKSNKKGLYVYKSVTDECGTQKCVFVASYKQYRTDNPNGSFTDLLKPKTLDRWIKLYPNRIKCLLTIDADCK